MQTRKNSRNQRRFNASRNGISRYHRHTLRHHFRGPSWRVSILTISAKTPYSASTTCFWSTKSSSSGSAISPQTSRRTLARAFGTPSVYPVTRAVNPDSEDLPFMSEIRDSEDDPPNADGWHTDITWIPEPPKIGILSAIEIPETGGDTLWADIYHAYDELSPKMQEICESLTILHEVSPTILNATYNRGGDEAVRFVREHFPPVPHPLVRTHPETGRKALFVAGGFMIAVEGMSEEESKMFLDWLNSYISNPNFHLRWSWTEGDLAIWDERCTNHRALSNHYPPKSSHAPLHR